MGIGVCNIGVGVYDIGGVCNVRMCVNDGYNIQCRSECP